MPLSDRPPVIMGAPGLTPHRCVRRAVAEIAKTRCRTRTDDESTARRHQRPDRRPNRSILSRQTMDLIRQLKDLMGQLEELLVLFLLELDRLPLLTREDRTLVVRSVLADHHECRQEDRLERHGKGERRPRG